MPCLSNDPSLTLSPPLIPLTLSPSPSLLLTVSLGTNWQQFYQGAVQWFKTQADQTKNVKFFRCSPDHQVNITDGSETFPPIVLTGAETDAWLGR